MRDSRGSEDPGTQRRSDISRSFIETEESFVPVPFVITPPANETIVRQVNERPDSITLSSAARGGEIKVYFNAADMDDARTRIENAILLHEYANSLLAPHPVATPKKARA
jgi:hypothetical protein